MTEQESLQDRPTEQAEVAETETEQEGAPEAASRQERRDQHIRERLRETEAERNLLRDRLDARDRAAVETQARAALGERGAALFQFDLDALRDSETGNLDPERVEEALEPVRRALEEGRQVHHGDLGPRRTAPTRRGATWNQLLQQRRGT